MNRKKQILSNFYLHQIRKYEEYNYHRRIVSTINGYLENARLTKIYRNKFLNKNKVTNNQIKLKKPGNSSNHSKVKSFHASFLPSFLSQFKNTNQLLNQNKFPQMKEMNSMRLYDSTILKNLCMADYKYLDNLKKFFNKESKVSNISNAAEFIISLNNNSIHPINKKYTKENNNDVNFKEMDDYNQINPGQRKNFKLSEINLNRK